MSIVQRLTENIVERDLRQEGTALLNKWEKTGLLEGLDNDNQKNSMARLLENQAKELLREASTMSAGDVEGFAAVAFPIVRRVFGGLIANQLVSVQPMSLPSGLIFFLDFKFNNNMYVKDGPLGGDGTAWDSGGGWNMNQQGRSVYGGGALGSQITGGVELGGADAEHSFYALNNGYSSPTGTCFFAACTTVASGVVGSRTGDDVDGSVTDATLGAGNIVTSLSKLCRYDPDMEGKAACVVTVPGDVELGIRSFNREDLITITVSGSADAPTGPTNPKTLGALPILAGLQVRRLTDGYGRTAALADANLPALSLDDATNTSITLVFESTGTTAAAAIDLGAYVNTNTFHAKFVRRDSWVQGTGNPGSVMAELLGLEGAPNDNVGGAIVNTGSQETMNEINIDVDSVAVVATTKKLKAVWSPELGQDLNAYHNLDAEVELTSILSEQIALEIDREILNDLLKDGTAARYYWSRNPGRFVNLETGVDITANGANLPDFTGTVSEWYETLIETINYVSANIHRKTLRGGANFLVVGPEVANLLEFTSGFRASVTADSDKGTVGAVKIGALSSKFEVYVDPYFPRNVVLVGRKGSSFLESGYVYAPYVPLQVTPTIFGTEDFVPRKGVMTHYAKQMVRPDMYGVVIVQDLVG